MSEQKKIMCVGCEHYKIIQDENEKQVYVCIATDEKLNMEQINILKVVGNKCPYKN